VYPGVRGLLLATLLLLGGTAMASVLAARAGLDHVERGAVIRGWLARLPGLLAWFLLTMSIGRGALQVLAFHDPGAPIDPDLARAVLGSGAWGVGWMVQTLGSFALLGLTWLLRDRARWRTRAVLLFTAALLTAQAGMGHGADPHWQPVIVGRAVHLAHLIGSTIWLGTLGVLAIAVFPSLTGRDDRASLARVLTDFSVLARTGATLLVVSGVVATLRYTATFGDLLHTGWGRVLLAKLVLFVGVGLAGWWNWKVVTPRLTRDPLVPTSALRRAVLFELVLAAAVLALTTALVNLALPVDG
jgi:putative copper export protein